jgi:general secretion pathway protein C
MVSNLGNRWAVAACTFALWGLVAASAVYWALKLIHLAPTIPAAPVARTSAPVDPAAVARVLGFSPTAAAAAAAPSLASRFSLAGVVAGRSHEGAALIAVDGRPAKPFRIGAQVDEGLVLQSVEARRATLAASAEGPPALTLELPPRK